VSIHSYHSFISHIIRTHRKGYIGIWYRQGGGSMVLQWQGGSELAQVWRFWLTGSSSRGFSSCEKSTGKIWKRFGRWRS